MVSIVKMLDGITNESLVLFDELCAGTDPVEGAALAHSIIEAVREKGAMCMATTHYAELKAYALQTKGVCNASCEFDVATLKPTYKLVIGTPGKSNAFAISEKLGMPSDVIDRADRLIERDNKRFEDVIEQLDTNRIELEREKNTAEKLRREYEDYKRTAEAELKKRIAKSEEEIAKSTLKARQILDSARASSEFIFRQLEDLKKQEDKEKRNAMMLDARNAVRARMRESEGLFDGLDVREVSLDEEYKLPRPLVIGDKVYLVTLAQEGVVTALKDSKGLIAVTAGILKTKVTEDKLRLIEGDVKFNDEYVRYGNYTESCGLNAAEYFANVGVTAVVCASDLIAIGLINGLKTHGLKTPEDISVSGFDNLDVARYFSPSLTTVKQDFTTLGENAFTLLRQAIKGNKTKRITIHTEAIFRESTAPVKKQQ
jgi:DNA mismatch repair protein MutS2